MKASLRNTVLAVSCFLAGFLTCYLLTQPHAKPAPVVTGAPTFTPIAMVALPTVITQEFRIDDGIWYQWPDGTKRRSVPPEMRPSFYDLIDTRAQPGLE